MLVFTVKDDEFFYVGDTKIRVLIEEYLVEGKLEKVVEFEIYRPQKSPG